MRNIFTAQPLLALLLLATAAKTASAVDVSEVDIDESMYTILVDAENPKEAVPYHHHAGKTRGHIALRPSFVDKIRTTAATAAGESYSSVIEDVFPTANLVDDQSHTYMHMHNIGKNILTSMTSLTATSEAHTDTVLQFGDRPPMPRDDKVGLIFLNTNADAHFDVDDTCIPVQKHRLVLFDGGKSVHRTVVQKGRVSLLGPFHAKTFVGVGAVPTVPTGAPSVLPSAYMCENTPDAACCTECVSGVPFPDSSSRGCAAGQVCCSFLRGPWGEGPSPDDQCDVPSTPPSSPPSVGLGALPAPTNRPSSTPSSLNCAYFGGSCSPSCSDNDIIGAKPGEHGCADDEICCGNECELLRGGICSRTCSTPDVIGAEPGEHGCANDEICCGNECEILRGGTCCQSCSAPVVPGLNPGELGCPAAETCCYDMCDNGAGTVPTCSEAGGSCCAGTCASSPIADTTGCSGGDTCCPSGDCTISTPTGLPSSSPSQQPSSMPSDTPTNVPSSFPSNQPSYMPSYVPSRIPSSSPSNQPSLMPSTSPSSSPSSEPSKQCENECTTGKSKSGTLERGCIYYKFKKMEEAIHHMQATRSDGLSPPDLPRLPKCEYRCIPESDLPSPSFPKEFIHIKGQNLRGNLSPSDDSDSSETNSHSSSSGSKEQVWYQYGRNEHLPSCRDPPPVAPKELK